MMTTKVMPVAANNDAELVGESLAGNRDAFAQIVSRYQSLICSLAYNATGSLGHSEDLAQETFISAWKHLSHLRERHKLRSWLCGIARNRINNFLRREGREPIRKAEPIEHVSESHSSEPLPVEQTISKEEEAILWRSLQRIPDVYREPLILFYREHQSIETVAANLDLSEDAVKQRLSRGRKMLQEQVLAFVEGALEKTSPGKDFTLGVIAALPLAVASAKAATIGGAIAKGGTAAKSVVTIGSLGGFFVMLGGIYLSLRAQADDTKSTRERQFMQQMIGVRMVFFQVIFAVFIAVKEIDFFQQPLAHDITLATIFFTITIMGTLLMDYSIRRQRQIQTEDGTFDESEWTQPRWKTEPLLAPATGRSKSQNLQKVARFMALPMIFVIYLLIRNNGLVPHNGSYAGAVGFAIIYMVLIFGGWRQRPRFQKPKSGRQFGMLVIMAVFTLVICNNPQSGLPASTAISPSARMILNGIVVTAYAAFAGFLVFKNRSAGKII